MTEEFDSLFERAVREIAGKEAEIIDQFAKAFVAAKSITTESDVAWLITHLQLNRQDNLLDGSPGYRYWFSFREEESCKTE